MRGRSLCLFLDASLNPGNPVLFERVIAARDRRHTTHSLSPAALLEVYRRAFCEDPPEAYVLAVAGVSFELGEGLSLQAEANLEEAWRHLVRLLRSARPDVWESAAKAASGPTEARLTEARYA